MDVLNSNQIQKYQFYCQSHPRNNFIFLNTNLNNKQFLACEICLVEDELDTNQLLPLDILNKPCKIDYCKFFHSIKKNSSLYKIYQRIRNEDLQQKKQIQNDKLKDFRSRINFMLDQIEKVSEDSMKTLEDCFQFIQQFNENYIQRICKLLDGFTNGNGNFNKSYQNLLIDYELESQQILDLFQNIEDINKNQFYQKNNEKLDNFLNEINSQVNNQFESIKQIQMSSINYIYEGIKFEQIKFEQQHIIGQQNDSSVTKLESKIKINCNQCSSTIIQKRAKYLNKLVLQKPTLKDTTFFLRKMNPNQFYIEFKLNLYNCSNKYIKDIISESTQIPQKYIQNFYNQEVIQNQFTKQQFVNLRDYYQTHSCELKFNSDQKLINVLVFQSDNIDDEYLVNYFKAKDFKRIDQFYHNTSDNISRKKLLIELYNQIRINLQNYQKRSQNNYPHKVKSTELITDDQAILEIQYFSDIFSFYDNQIKKININDDSLYQFNQTNNNIIILFIKDDKDNKFAFSIKESDSIEQINYPVNENFFAEYFMKNFQDEITIDFKNDIILFCQKCGENKNCQIETTCNQLPSDQLIIDCSQIKLEFQRNKFQAINLNSNEVLNITLLNNQKYCLQYCLVQNNLKKLEFIIKCSETQGWYTQFKNEQKQINQQEINNFIPIYLYYKKQKEN